MGKYNVTKKIIICVFSVFILISIFQYLVIINYINCFSLNVEKEKKSNF